MQSTKGMTNTSHKRYVTLSTSGPLLTPVARQAPSPNVRGCPYSRFQAFMLAIAVANNSLRDNGTLEEILAITPPDGEATTVIE